jgi:signal transduction histidine kinase
MSASAAAPSPAEVTRYRLLAGAAVVLVPLVSLAQRLSTPDPVDPIWLRLCVSAICGAFLIASYVSGRFRTNIHGWALPVYYLVDTYAIWLMYANDFDTTYVIGLMLVVTAVSVAARTPAHLILITAYTLVTATVAVIATESHRTSGTALLASLVALVVVSYIVFASRYRVQRGLVLRTAELSEAQKHLQQEIEEKNDMLRTVSHDLAAPLRNIVGMVDSAVSRHGSDLSDTVKDRLARVRRNADNALSLIDELLELSRIQARLAPWTEVDVGEIVRAATSLLSDDLERRGVEVVMPDVWPTIPCDKERCTQLFQNLVDNAIKYATGVPAPRIVFAWKSAGSGFVFSVSDNGPGIAEEELHRVFTVFRRGTKAPAAETAGKGVGLAAVKAIARAHGGNAWIESAPGDGCTFYVALDPQSVPYPKMTPAPSRAPRSSS